LKISAIELIRGSAMIRCQLFVKAKWPRMGQRPLTVAFMAVWMEVSNINVAPRALHRPRLEW
jgi:hypothetical protein